MPSFLDAGSSSSFLPPGWTKVGSGGRTSGSPWGSVASSGFSGGTAGAESSGYGPDPSIDWMRNQAGAQNTYLNQQIAALNAQLNQSGAFFTGQQRASQQQQDYAQQLLQNQLAQVANGQAGGQAQAQYNQFLTGYNNSLLDVQNQANGDNLAAARAALDELQRHGDVMGGLSNQSWANTQAFLTQSGQLDQAAFNAAIAWLSKQGNFNSRDLALTQQAIKNLITTERAKYGEVQRVKASEQTLAGGRRDQRANEADFSRDVQGRAAQSDAITRGAMTSVGHTQDVQTIGRQYNLAVASSNRQFRSDMESIRTAFAQGKINFQDAQRGAGLARQRAQFVFDQTQGNLANQQAQAQQTLDRANLLTGHARDEAYAQYQAQIEAIKNAQNQGTGAFNQAQNAFDERQRQAELERQRIAAEDEMRRQQWEAQQRQYDADRRQYEIQQQQARAAYQQQQQQAAYQQQQQIAAMNAQRQQVEQQRAAAYAAQQAAAARNTRPPEPLRPIQGRF